MDKKKLKILFTKLLHILEENKDDNVIYIIESINKILLELNLNTSNNESMLLLIVEEYNKYYPTHGGLTDFFIWYDNFDESAYNVLIL